MPVFYFSVQRGHRRDEICSTSSIVRFYCLPIFGEEKIPRVRCCPLEYQRRKLESRRSERLVVPPCKSSVKNASLGTVCRYWTECKDMTIHNDEQVHFPSTLPLSTPHQEISQQTLRSNLWTEEFLTASTQEFRKFQRRRLEAVAGHETHRDSRGEGSRRQKSEAEVVSVGVTLHHNRAGGPPSSSTVTMTVGEEKREQIMRSRERRSRPWR